MAKPSHELFRLIQSLSTPEKSYFRKYASAFSKSKQANYLKLFDYLNSLDEYDEAKVKSHFKGERFVNQLTRIKNYLYQQIIRSLAILHEDKSLDNRLTRDLKEVEILFGKTLYDQCRKKLQKIEAIAIKHERFQFILQVLDWKRRLLNEMNYQDVDEQDLYKIYALEQDTLKKISNISEYWILTAQMNLTLKTSGQVRKPELIKKLDEIMSHPFLKDEKNVMCNASLSLYDHLHAMYARATGNMEKAYYHRRREYLRWLKNPSPVAEERLKEEIKFSLNYILAAYTTRRFDEVKKHLLRLKPYYYADNQRLSDELKTHTFSFLFIIESDLYIKTGQFHHGTRMVEENLPYIERYYARTGKMVKASIEFNIACLYFGAGKMDECLKWINYLCNDEIASTSVYFYGIALILRILAHYESGNIDLLEPLTRNAYRHLKTRNNLFQTEKIMLRFLGTHLLKAYHDRSLLKQAFLKLRNELENVLNKPLEANALDSFHFLAWVDSKLEGISFEQSVQNHFERSQKINATQSGSGENG